MGAWEISCDYDVILHKEIMLEAFAGLMADFDRITAKEGIDVYSDEGKNTLLGKMYWQINDIHKHILGSRYKTMEDMLEIRGTFKFFNQFVKGVMAE